jgi:hypothetical protein
MSRGWYSELLENRIRFAMLLDAGKKEAFLGDKHAVEMLDDLDDCSMEES